MWHALCIRSVEVQEREPGASSEETQNLEETPLFRRKQTLNRTLSQGICFGKYATCTRRTVITRRILRARNVPNRPQAWMRKLVTVIHKRKPHELDPPTEYPASSKCLRLRGCENSVITMDWTTNRGARNLRCLSGLLCAAARTRRTRLLQRTQY